MKLNITRETIDEMEYFLNRLTYYNENVFNCLSVETKALIIDTLAKKIEEFNNLKIK